jgi:hypothetical protein
MYQTLVCIGMIVVGCDRNFYRVHNSSLSITSKDAGNRIAARLESWRSGICRSFHLGED